ncbi:uncharacterized protein [Ptychodera flava]|uniref:uncharacterized protein n=1 Tax=Ptychodera flava TaxID=63121 RepID=UPI00396A0491
MEQTLRDLYYNPITGFGAAQKLYEAACDVAKLKVTKKEVQDWLQTQTHQWAPILPQLLKNYNNTVHGSIKMKPIDTTEANDWQEFYILYGHEMAAAGAAPVFKHSERVQITKYKGTFKKGYLPNWTEEIFIVTKVIYTAGLQIPLVYKIKDLNGEEILGTFYSNELQRISSANNTDSADGELHRVERILKTKKVKGKKYYLIKWRGYPESFNSWEPEETVISIT